jgi:hypothetical protein
MSNFNNPKNVIGMGGILADDDDEEDIDIDEIERSITSGIAIKKKDEKNIDLAKEYAKEIEDLGRRFNVGGGKPSMVSNDDDDEDDGKGIDDLLNWSPYNKPAVNNNQNSNKSNRDNQVPNKYGNSDSNITSYKAPYNLADDEDDADADDADNNNATNDNYNNSYPTTWSSNHPNDEQLNTMTNEERKQQQVNRVLGNMELNDDDADFVQKENEEDEMARIMEQIDLLKSMLEGDGVDLSRIPEVNSGTSKKEAKSILRILQLKNDRSRYCDFFEESMLAVAYGLEGVFNGKREILGSKIDLTGYSDTVKVKLRRMRYDTGTFVSGIMQGYNISSGWRIMLELIPSLFFYSRDRRLTAKDNLISDESYKKAMQELP